MAFRRGRQTFREQQRTLAQAELAHDQSFANAKLADPEVHQVVKDGILRRRAWAAQAALPPPPKRDRVVRPVDGKPALPLEREIQKACLMLLRVHPKVAFAYRINSGTFTEQNADGSTRYINAHSMPGMSDLCAVLKGSGRACYFEVKRPGQKPTRLQEQFLERAAAAGAIAAVVTDPQQIVELLS